jgi:hypothetical protein
MTLDLSGGGGQCHSLYRGLAHLIAGNAKPQLDATKGSAPALVATRVNGADIGISFSESPS